VYPHRNVGSRAAYEPLPKCSIDPWPTTRGRRSGTVTRTTSAAISVDGLTTRFGDRVAVGGITLDIPGGVVTSFIGQPSRQDHDGSCRSDSSDSSRPLVRVGVTSALALVEGEQSRDDPDGGL
jgi:hypothetical protein